MSGKRRSDRRDEQIAVRGTRRGYETEVPEGDDERLRSGRSSSFLAGRRAAAIIVVVLLGTTTAACSGGTVAPSGSPVAAQAVSPLVLHREGFTNRIAAAQPGNYYLLTIAKPDQRGPNVLPPPSDGAIYALTVAQDSTLATTPETANPSMPPTSASEAKEEDVTVRGKPARLWGVSGPRPGGSSSRRARRGCVQWRESSSAIAQLCFGELNPYVKDGDPDSRTMLMDTANELVAPSGDEWFALQRGTDQLNLPKPTPFFTSSQAGATISIGQYGEDVRMIDEYVAMPDAAADDFNVHIVVRSQFVPYDEVKPAGVVDDPYVAPPGTGSTVPPLPRLASMSRYEEQTTERGIPNQTLVQVRYPPTRKAEARRLLDSLRVANDDEIKAMLAAPVDPVVAALHTAPFHMTKRVA
jgi:hypothetical protein